MFMANDDTLSLPVFALQPQRSGDSESCWSDPIKHEQFFITLICATGVKSGSRRRPPSFYVTVQIDGETIKTRKKPALSGKEELEWWEEILLPSDRSCIISFKAFASYKLGPRRRNEVLLGQIRTSVGDVLGYNEKHESIRFSNKNISPSSLSLRVVTEQRVRDLNESVTKHGLLESDEFGQLARLTGAGNSDLLRYHRLQNRKHLSNAITHFQHACDISSPRHLNHNAVLFNLATAKFVYCQDNNHYHDLNAATTLYRDALRLHTCSHSDYPVTAFDLCFALLTHLNQLTSEGVQTQTKSPLCRVAELSVVVRYAYRAAWLALQMAGIWVPIQTTGICVGQRVSPGGKEFTRRERAIIPRLPNRNPCLPESLTCSPESLLRLLGSNDKLFDVDEAILVLETTIPLVSDGHPDKRTWLNCLGESLFRRYKRLRDITDINKSVSTFAAAVRLTPDLHPDKPGALHSFGVSLAVRFDHLTDPEDIDKSISVLEEAVGLISSSHPNMPRLLNNLGASLERRYVHLGNLADINQSISVAERAARLTPDGHPDRLIWLSNLGNSLQRRFEHLDDLVDINKSISLHEEALCLAPNGHPTKPILLNGLGISLWHRFRRLSDLADIKKSISMLEDAVHFTPDGHPDKVVRLGNLGNSLRDYFEYAGDPVDINKSILVLEEAVRLAPDGHANKQTGLHNLGCSLFCRFESLGNSVDNDRAILMLEESVRLTPDGHHNIPHQLAFLGKAFVKRFMHSRDPSHLSPATSCLSAASLASTGSISTRFHAACAWIVSARLQGNSQVVLDACTAAVNLIPHLAWLGLPLAERHRVLLKATDVARDAAAAALEALQAEKAVEWLEQGRSVIWNQLMQLRTPVDELRCKHPSLAHEFQRVSSELEHAASRDNVTLENGLIVGASPLEDKVQRHHDLALRRERLLAQIRSLPGFDRFLLSKTIKQLASSAYSGPVIYLNASRQRCDALIVRAESGYVIPVPLPITYREGELLQSILRLLLERNRLVISRDDISALVPSEENISSQKLLRSLLDDDINRAVKVKPQQIMGYTPDDLFGRILAYLWMDVVKPVLGALGLLNPPSGDEKLARIFWCPTGPFAFLPIHAAGLYGIAEAGAQLSNFAISSYIPTLSAISSLDQKTRNRVSSNICLVVVPQPSTDGLSRLVSVSEEIDCIRTLSSMSSSVTLQDSDGTIGDIMEKMKYADWVHFACHGIQDPHNPLDSGLCLADGRRLKLSDIIRLSRPQGGLAFLSACQTAQGHKELAEESVHLAAGMLLAGYGGVIATMWAIRDSDGPKVTKRVYEHLFRDGKIPDSVEAAEALHYAVQRLRESGASFSSWVPFIHVGR